MSGATTADRLHESPAGSPRGRARSVRWKKVRRVMWIVAVTVAAVLLALFLGLLAVSPGEPEPFLNAAGEPLKGSVSDKVHVEINGVRQGMFLKGKDAKNPVLLYVHGGMPDYFLTRQFPTGMEDQVTVVWWEQRGSGVSYSPDIPRESMTLDQLVSDVVAVTNYLRQRFGQDKIYLMGHSGGTFIGLLAAAQAPELYHAYIGVAQMAHQAESERLAYVYMLERARAAGDTSLARRLEATPPSSTGVLPPEYYAVRDDAMHGLGIGTMREMRSVVTGLLIPSFLFREYTLKEKLDLWRGKASAGVSVVWKDMLATDLRETVKEVQVPVYFLHGVHDYTVSYPLARSFFDRLRAPRKGFYTFQSSAHSPMFEEPERVNRVLREDVLAGRAGLSDEPSGS